MRAGRSARNGKPNNISKESSDVSLKVDLRVGETLTFNNGQIVITLLEKSGQRARISVEADDSVEIQPPSRETSGPAVVRVDDVQKMLVGAV